MTDEVSIDHVGPAGRRPGGDPGTTGCRRGGWSKRCPDRPRGLPARVVIEVPLREPLGSRAVLDAEPG